MGGIVTISLFAPAVSIVTHDPGGAANRRAQTSPGWQDQRLIHSLVREDSKATRGRLGRGHFQDSKLACGKLTANRSDQAWKLLSLSQSDHICAQTIRYAIFP